MATKKSTKQPASKPAAKPTPAIKKGGSTKKKAVAAEVTRTTASTYVAVSHHIYYDGYSYRVRASVNGTRYSQNFSSKKKAFEFRKRILNNG
jgi:hypothetical protein